MKHQRGLSLWGFIFVGMLVALSAIVAFKAVPAWIEFYTVKKAINAIVVSESAGATVGDIRRAFQRRADVDDISSVSAQDLEVTKVGGEIVINVSYAKKVPLFGNTSLLFDFEASTGGLRSLSKVD